MPPGGTPSSNVLAGVVTGVSVSHHHADIDAIAAARAIDPLDAMERVLARESVTECFVLQTCNRTEWYVVTEGVATGRAVLGEEFPTHDSDAVQVFSHDEALEHLLRVGAGLESMILGEDQIVGQLRRACHEAERVGALGYLLEEAVWKAIHVGERVRTDTDINEGVTSLARAGVDLVRRERDLTTATALTVGAGEMGTRAAHALADASVDRLLVANRTVPHAEEIARSVSVKARALGLDGLETALRQADVVVTATGSPDPIIDRELLASAGNIVAVDLGQPRDIDRTSASIETVEFYDLDDLEALTRKTQRERASSVSEVEQLLDEELHRLHTRFKRKQADDVLAAMYEGADRIKRRELRDIRNKLAADGELSDEQVNVVESFADALVGQLLAAPTKSLRKAAAEDDWETIQTALHLFDPDFPDGHVTANPVGEDGSIHEPTRRDA